MAILSMIRKPNQKIEIINARAKRTHEGEIMPLKVELPDKTEYNMDHNIFQTFHIGRLQTLSYTRTLPGDQISFNLEGLVRLAPLVRPLSIMAIFDIFVFWTPWNMIYSNFKTMVEQGYDETQTLGSWTHATPNPGAPGMSYLGNNMIIGQTYPDWVLHDYNKIYNWWFREKTLTPEVQDSYQGASTSPPTGHNATNSLILGSDGTTERYGFPIGRLPHAVSMGIVPTQETASDREIVLGANLDVVEVNKLMHYVQMERELDWFGPDFREIMETNWGVSNLDKYIDERPMLVDHRRATLSGQDLDGLADSNFGDQTGVSRSNHQMILDRMFFPEHGTLRICAAVRFPTVMYHECDPMVKISNPSHLQAVGQYQEVLLQEPAADTLDKWTMDGSTTALGTHPYGQENRFHTNHVHQDFGYVNGYPFSETNDLASHPAAIYVNSTKYDDMFSSLVLGHANFQGSCEMTINRRYPSTRQSIYGGLHDLQ